MTGHGRTAEPDGLEDGHVY